MTRIRSVISSLRRLSLGRSEAGVLILSLLLLSAGPAFGQLEAEKTGGQRRGGGLQVLPQVRAEGWAVGHGELRKEEEEQ